MNLYLLYFENFIEYLSGAHHIIVIYYSFEPKSYQYNTLIGSGKGEGVSEFKLKNIDLWRS